MPGTYIDASQIKSLTNKELIAKQKQLEIQISKTVLCHVSNEIANDMQTLYELYTAEIDNRIATGKLDEDEFEED